MKLGKNLIIILVIAVLVIIIISSAVRTYNGLVTLEEGVDVQWAQVENVYQRRADLIPNLVETVKGYAKHEQETFTKVIEARSKATSIQVNADNLNEATLQQFQQAQDGITSALSRLLVVIEKYPDLKANQNFLELQAQLEGTENRITVERKKFNEAAQGYNTDIRKFPKNLYASIFGFDRKPYFESSPGAEEAPKIEF